MQLLSFLQMRCMLHMITELVPLPCECYELLGIKLLMGYLKLMTEDMWWKSKGVGYTRSLFLFIYSLIFRLCIVSYIGWCLLAFNLFNFTFFNREAATALAQPLAL